MHENKYIVDSFYAVGNDTTVSIQTIRVVHTGRNSNCPLLLQPSEVHFINSKHLYQRILRKYTDSMLTD